MVEVRNVALRVNLRDVPRYEDIYRALLKTRRYVDRGKYPLRDFLAVSTLAFTGIRIGELAALSKHDVDLENQVIIIRQQKKRREQSRVIPVPIDWYWFYMERYYALVDGNMLFNLSTRQLRNIVYKWSMQFLGKKIKPHYFRHAYALNFLRKNKDLEALRRLLGHSDYKVLKVYLDFTQEDLRKELEKVLVIG